ncbi:MAG TPA: nuclear transport factor 2 family protein, partial [Actinomycetota bacterium]
FTHPFREPSRGRDAIVKSWTEHVDPPGSWDCRYEALAVNGNTGVVRGHTTYFKADGSVETEYANIFVIEFDDDSRATEFTEFFMESNPPPRPS